MYPSQELLEMEVKANDIFSRYAKLYFDTNYLSSVYFFDAENNGFGSCWLIKKSKYNCHISKSHILLKRKTTNAEWILETGTLFTSSLLILMPKTKQNTG